MKEVVNRLTEEYAAAMQDFLAGQGEAALRRAYEAGRRALSDGLGVLEMVAVHQESVIAALQSHPGDLDHVLRQAISCFAESL